MNSTTKKKGNTDSINLVTENKFLKEKVRLLEDRKAAAKILLKIYDWLPNNWEYQILIDSLVDFFVKTDKDIVSRKAIVSEKAIVWIKNTLAKELEIFARKSMDKCLSKIN